MQSWEEVNTWKHSLNMETISLNINTLLTSSVRGMKRLYQSASSLIAAFKFNCKVSQCCSRAATAIAAFPSTGKLLLACWIADFTFKDNITSTLRARPWINRKHSHSCVRSRLWIYHCWENKYGHWFSHNLYCTLSVHHPFHIINVHMACENMNCMYRVYINECERPITKQILTR